MTKDIEQLLPEVEDSPNGRRQHYRMRPAKMLAVMGTSEEPMDLSKPELVIDFSLGGLAVLTAKSYEIGDEAIVSIFYESLELKLVPVKIVSKVTHGEFSRLGMKMDETSAAYRFQKPRVEEIELKCIERAEF